MAERAPEVSLTLVGTGGDGIKFDRWTSVSLSMRIDAAAAGFQFEHVDKKADFGDALGINEGDEVVVRIDRTKVLTGYVDVVKVQEDLDRGPVFSVSGRSKTKDLVDCHATHSTGEWNEQTILTIAREVCEPFGLTATIDPDLDPDKAAQANERAALPFRRLCIDPGESAFEVINKAAQERGLLLTAAEDGNLLITVSGGKRLLGRLERGVNVGAGASRTGDERDRFSEYRIVGARAQRDSFHGEQARGGEATVEDEQVGRYRPFVAQSDGTAETDFERRAEWERNRRAGRSRTATIPVLSWFSPQGEVWRPNRIIGVKHDVLRVEGDLMVSAVDLRWDGENGDVGALELMAPGAFDPLQSPKTRRNRKVWAAWA